MSSRIVFATAVVALLCSCATAFASRNEPSRVYGALVSSHNVALAVHEQQGFINKGFSERDLAREIDRSAPMVSAAVAYDKGGVCAAGVVYVISSETTQRHLQLMARDSAGNIWRLTDRDGESSELRQVKAPAGGYCPATFSAAKRASFGA